jgi:hypothetical protein
MSDTRNKMQSLDWEINLQPVYTTGERLLRGYQTIVRDDKDVVLCVMKDSYHPRTNKEFTDIVQQLALLSKSKAPYFTEYDSGKKVLAFLESPKKSTIGGHKISDKILVGNSFDGSSSLFIATVLSYGGSNFTYLNSSAAFRISHRSKDLEQCFDYIEMLKDYEEEKTNLYNRFDQMLEVKLTDAVIEDFIKAVVEYKTVDDEGEKVEISTRTQNKIDDLKLSIEKKCNEHGKNVWGLFNGATNYTTNVYSGNKKRNIEGNMYGTQNTMNQRALNYCLDLIQ